MTTVIQEVRPKYDRKRLYELSLKLLGEIPQLDPVTEEQKQWIKRKGVR